MKSAHVRIVDSDHRPLVGHTSAYSLTEMVEMLRPQWMLEAACRDTNTAEWFPGRGDLTTHLLNRCAACPVIRQCREHANQDEDETAYIVGFVGGLSAVARRRLARAGIPYVDAPLPQVVQVKPKIAPAPAPPQTTRRTETHGTVTGYSRHRRRGEAACTACKAAIAKRARDKRRRRRIVDMTAASADHALTA